jgi:hypothetical protein
LNKSIYTVYKTEDAAGSDVYVILTVTGDEVLFSATVPVSQYKSIFTFSPAPVLNYEGVKLVKHETFFWGEHGRPEAIKIDGETFPEFHKSTNSEYQIVNNAGSYAKLIEAFKAGNSAVLDKHYWGRKKKGYPSFSLVGFTKAYHIYIEGKGRSLGIVEELHGGRPCPTHPGPTRALSAVVSGGRQVRLHLRASREHGVGVALAARRS